MTIILDNARYQRCALVQAVVQELGIAWLFLPSYSPDLNLIERLWRFVKKQCVYSKDYPDSTSFQQAILTCIQQAPTMHKEELNLLLTLRLQTFQEVSVIGEQQLDSERPKKKSIIKGRVEYTLVDN